MKRLSLLAVSLSLLLALFVTTTASAHVHGITPLLTLAGDCGVTSVSNTGANRAQGDPIPGLIPRDVGNAPLDVGDGGFSAPVGCATHGPLAGSADHAVMAERELARWTRRLQGRERREGADSWGKHACPPTSRSAAGVATYSSLSTRRVDLRPAYGVFGRGG
jgi:hypothetical protein